MDLLRHLNQRQSVWKSHISINLPRQPHEYIEENICVGVRDINKYTSNTCRISTYFITSCSSQWRCTLLEESYVFRMCMSWMLDCVCALRFRVVSGNYWTEEKNNIARRVVNGLIYRAVFCSFSVPVHAFFSSFSSSCDSSVKKLEEITTLLFYGLSAR